MTQQLPATRTSPWTPAARLCGMHGCQPIEASAVEVSHGIGHNGHHDIRQQVEVTPDDGQWLHPMRGGGHGLCICELDLALPDHVHQCIVLESDDGRRGLAGAVGVKAVAGQQPAEHRFLCGGI